MAQSRLEKIGTIFSRVSNLIRTGAMNINDRPLWYDVYRAFPPATAPRFERPVSNVKIMNIFYKEDLIRAKFHKDMGRSLPITNMTDTKYLTLTQKMIDLCTKLQKEKNLDFENAYQEAFSAIKAERFSKYKATENIKDDLASTFKAALQHKNDEKQYIKPNVKDIFLDK